MPFPYTQQNADLFIRNVLQNEQALVRAIVWPDVGFVGTVGLHLREPPYQGSAELAYWIGEPFWGQGIATQAVRQMLAFGFAQEQLRRIYATVFSFNTGSIKVLANNGSRQEVVARAAILKNDQVWDEITLGLLREEFFSAKTPLSYRSKYRSSRPAEDYLS